MTEPRPHTDADADHDTGAALLVSLLGLFLIFVFCLSPMWFFDDDDWNVSHRTRTVVLVPTEEQAAEHPTPDRQDEVSGDPSPATDAPTGAPDLSRLGPCP